LVSGASWKISLFYFKQHQQTSDVRAAVCFTHTGNCRNIQVLVVTDHMHNAWTRGRATQRKFIKIYFFCDETMIIVMTMFLKSKSQYLIKTSPKKLTKTWIGISFYMENCKSCKAKLHEFISYTKPGSTQTYLFSFSVVKLLYHLLLLLFVKEMRSTTSCIYKVLLDKCRLK